MASENRPRVLLADDHPSVIEYVSNLLSKNFEVVGVVSDGLLVADAIKETHPDLIVMDISMPGLDGIRTAQSLGRSKDTPKIVFLTVTDDEEYISAAFAAGAARYPDSPAVAGRADLSSRPTDHPGGGWAANSSTAHEGHARREEQPARLFSLALRTSMCEMPQTACLGYALNPS